MDDENRLIAVSELPENRDKLSTSPLPQWPFSRWTTTKLIRDGQLRCVKIGARFYITKALINEFIARHTGATHAA